MWRREVIRLVLALNWCVFGWSCGMALYGHPHIWGMNSWRMAEEDVPLPDDGKADTRDVYEARLTRRLEYDRRTNWVGESGQRGWWLGCGASLGTAVLLMIAFPKKQTAGSPEITQT